MSERDNERERPTGEDPFVREVRRVADRASRRDERNFWRSLGLLTGVGWLIVLPAIGGALIGRWLDTLAGTPVFWTLSLLVLGLALGCVFAWRYLDKELGDKDDQGSDREPLE